MTRIPRIVGHRGAAKAAPENTLESLREAKRQGAACVEVDAKLTADNAIILMHDDILDRTTSGQGLVAQATLEQIRALDAGSWLAPNWAGVRVPTLEEAVQELTRLGLNCNVEIKPCPGRELVTAELVMRALQRLWPARWAELSAGIQRRARERFSTAAAMRTLLGVYRRVAAPAASAAAAHQGSDHPAPGQ